MMEISLAVPLTMAQIEAANRLHGKLIQWQVTDRALHILQENLPGFDSEATLLKVVAVNQLYGTNVYAVVRMVRHVFEQQSLSSFLKRRAVQTVHASHEERHRLYGRSASSQ